MRTPVDTNVFHSGKCICIVLYHICVGLDGVISVICVFCQHTSLCAAVELDEWSAAVVTSVTAV